ncbi:response regulator [Nonlabens ponticola]|nr:response regulator [Nonlabens ponticola]
MIDKKLKILIVEDSITDAALIQRQVRKTISDPEIVMCDSILKVRHALKTFIPDFVFTDYALVGFTGMDVIENVKDIYPAVPIVMITGTLNDEELAANAVLKGASAYLLKNDINNLHEKLEPILERLIVEKSRLFDKLERERQEREKLEEIHSLLKEAAMADDKQETTQEYYTKLLSNIGDRLKTIIK